MREVGYDFAYMFKYSERPGTFAQKHLGDDVPEEVKSRRLQEIIALQNELGLASYRRDVGREFEVLVEGASKRNPNQLSGRTSQNKVVVFDRGGHRAGEYVRGAHYGLHGGDALRRGHVRMTGKYKKHENRCVLTNWTWRMRSSTVSKI